MTTATDWEPGTWTDTGSHAVVTDVTTLDGAATDGVPVTTALEKVNALLSEHVGQLGSEVLDLREQNERLHHELAALKAELHPLDERRDGWTPRPKTMPRKHWTQVHSVADLTEQQRNSALIEPKPDELRDGDGEIHLGAPIAAELMTGVDHRPGWATWLGEIHHTDAEWADIVARLRSMPDQYVAPPIERTVVEPVAVDYSYQQSDAWLWAEMVRGQSRQHDSVYDQLAPGRIHEGESPKAITPADEMKDSVNSERQPEGREGLDRMVKRVPTVISAQRPPRDTKGDVSLADYVNAIEAAEAVGVKIPPEPAPERPGTVRASWWARLAAWFGGATTRRRQTEQDGGEA